jgi:hypothetical protein
MSTTRKSSGPQLVINSPEDEAIKTADLEQIESVDVFGDLDQFKDTAAAAVEAVKRVLNRVPLMKAQGGGQKAGSLVRVHPTFELTGVGLVYDPREGGEPHLVTKDMVKPLAQWIVAVDLHVAITREGFEQGHWPVHLWPVPATAYDKSGKLSPHFQTHRLIVQHAKTQWLRMINGGRQYEEELPENPEKLPTVDWAAMPWAFADILTKAFSPSTHVILNAQHLLVDYLFGRA